MVSLMEVVKVGIADMNVVKAPQSIRTTGLGSCVGVVLYDETSGIAGLSHVMLPDSALNKDGAKLNKAKFADTAIADLRDCLIRSGAIPSLLKAKIAGGAQMFQFASQSDVMRIGPRNVEAVKKELQRFNIKLAGEDVGGNNGRTIEFDTETSLLHIRTVSKGEAVL
ncbi:chemotaxis protein CheD [Falsibacillus albus]|uniref:Probable chemoreceptor glutamine deamidase CheD n=1 Tax=Falsibacillus albus TaxID=2478915 RepID=A0A3L7K4T7_9BACI|nr:chemotaxis protein CheD [Falsibacillus albus]RLQ95722.1 chemotaxis protein CheD [Falsibacillus albus]